MAIPGTRIVGDDGHVIDHNAMNDELTSMTAAIAGKASTAHVHDALAIETGVMDPERLGAGTPTSDTVLDGTGQWVDIESISSRVITVAYGEDPPAGTPVGYIILREEG